MRKGGDERKRQIHIFSADDKENIECHIAVPDHLRTHPESAAEYGALKEELARLYPYDIEKYCDGKDSFMKELERTALIWKARGN